MANTQLVVDLEPRNRAKLDAERIELLTEGQQLPAAIANPTEYTALADFERRLASFIDWAEPVFDEHCADLHKVWKQATTIRAAFIDAPKKLKARIRELLGAYVELQERTRLAEQRLIEQEERRAEELRRAAEVRALERSGQPELAQAVKHAPLDLPPVELPNVVPEVEGLSYREDWYWEPIGGDTPTNRTRAVGLLVKQIQFATLVKLDDAGLTSFAKRTKGTQPIPGIAFRSRKVPVRR